MCRVLGKGLLEKVLGTAVFPKHEEDAELLQVPRSLSPSGPLSMLFSLPGTPSPPSSQPSFCSFTSQFACCFLREVFPDSLPVGVGL